MDTTLSITNGSRFPKVTEFVLMGVSRHSAGNTGLLPLALLYLLALGANLLILITIHHESTLHQPMYYLSSYLGCGGHWSATTIMPKILAIFWFNAKHYQSV